MYIKVYTTIMGQYYIAIILGEKGTKEFIRFAISSFAYACGSKLAEHSYIGNPFVEAVEYLISPNGIFYKSRLVWAGDYADKEPDSNETLYTRGSSDINTEKMEFIINTIVKINTTVINKLFYFLYNP
jgi:hypothetical protein